MNKEYLEMYKEGFFYGAYGKDALILAMLFNYKTYYKVPETIGIGFPESNLKNVCGLLESRNISYILYSSKTLIIEKEFVSPNNKYIDYIKQVNTILQNSKLTYEEYIQKLKERLLKNNKSEKICKQSENISSNTVIKKSLVVQVNDTIEILFDDETKSEVIKICQAVPVFTPTWLGNHDQNSRRTSKVEYKSDADFSKGEISSESPLAKAILGKPAQTRFIYRVNNIINSGIILKIYKDKQ